MDNLEAARDLLAEVAITCARSIERLEGKNDKYSSGAVSAYDDIKVRVEKAIDALTPKVVSSLSLGNNILEFRQI